MAGEQDDLVGVVGAGELSHHIVGQLLRQVLGCAPHIQSVWASKEGSRAYRRAAGAVYEPSCLELPCAV